MQRGVEVRRSRGAERRRGVEVQSGVEEVRSSVEGVKSGDRGRGRVRANVFRISYYKSR